MSFFIICGRGQNNGKKHIIFHSNSLFFYPFRQLLTLSRQSKCRFGFRLKMSSRRLPQAGSGGRGRCCILGREMTRLGFLVQVKCVEWELNWKKLGGSLLLIFMRTLLFTLCVLPIAGSILKTAFSLLSMLYDPARERTRRGVQDMQLYTNFLQIFQTPIENQTIIFYKIPVQSPWALCSPGKVAETKQMILKVVFSDPSKDQRGQSGQGLDSQQSAANGRNQVDWELSMRQTPNKFTSLNIPNISYPSQPEGGNGDIGGSAAKDSIFTILALPNKLNSNIDHKNQIHKLNNSTTDPPTLVFAHQPRTAIAG